jgi:hypothetical protein
LIPSFEVTNSETAGIPATEAKKHIGETATVYGKLYRVWFDTGRYVDNRGNATRYVIPIILDVGGYDTNRLFGIVLSDGDNDSFLRLKKFEGKEISVRGKIGASLTSGLPEMNIGFASRVSMWWQPPEGDEIIKPASGDLLDQIAAESAPPASQSLKPWERYQKPSTPAPQTSNVFDQFDPSNLNEKMPSWNDAGATNTIVTILGHVYHHAKITLVEPDGVTIKYAPDSGGFGGIKIPFGDLPLEYQQQYGYDPQQAAAYVEAKGKKEEQQKQAAQQAEAKQAQQDYEQAKEDYEQAKEEFDAEIKIQTLQAQQQIADAQSKTAQQAALQTRIMRAAAIERQIQEQQKLWEMQNQTYQQQRIADQINDLNWQLKMLMLNR